MDGGAALLGALLLVIRLLGVFGLLVAFRLLSGAEFNVVFFGHSALHFGIGIEPSFYYKIDTPIKFWNLQEDIKLIQHLLTLILFNF